MADPVPPDSHRPRCLIAPRSRERERRGGSIARLRPDSLSLALCRRALLRMGQILVYLITVVLINFFLVQSIFFFLDCSAAGDDVPGLWG